MNNIFILFIHILLLNTAVCFAQPHLQVNVIIQDNKPNKPYSDTIYHSTNRLLNWNDFQGQPDPTRDAGAVTASGFAYTADLRRTGKKMKLTIWIYTFFNKRNSWKKPKIISAYHLKHEQLHFDITRLAAQNFKSMLQAADFNSHNYQQLLSSVWMKAQENWNMMQTTYDKETIHSISVKEQKRWNGYVDEEIRRIYPGYLRETSHEFLLLKKV